MAIYHGPNQAFQALGDYTDQPSASDIQDRRLRSSNLHIALDNLGDDVWSSLCHSNRSWVSELLKMSFLMTITWYTVRPMLSCALIIGDPRRRGKNRPPVFIHPNLAGMELLDLFINSKSILQSLYYYERLGKLQFTHCLHSTVISVKRSKRVSTRHVYHHTSHGSI